MNTSFWIAAACIAIIIVAIVWLFGPFTVGQ